VLVRELRYQLFLALGEKPETTVTGIATMTGTGYVVFMPPPLDLGTVV
jgi:hypothetical protein